MPMGLMVYFSICFQKVLFCSRGAVVRKPLHCKTVVGSRVPGLVCATACRDTHKNNNNVGYSSVVVMVEICSVTDGLWVVFTCEESRAGWARVRERRARVRHDTAIITRCS